MLNKYDIILKLNKNDLVRIKNKENKESIGYVVGMTSGMFEIKSKIGDGQDLIGNNNIFSKKRSQYYITISTIKSIDKLSISLLGEINGL